jgi:hypothetical protein
MQAKVGVFHFCCKNVLELVSLISQLRTVKHQWIVWMYFTIPVLSWLTVDNGSSP